MTAPIYSIVTGAVALVAATAKTVIGVRAHANSGLQLIALRLGFDGVLATAVPVLVELCYCTWATQPPGTLSTSVTPVQKSGRVLAAGFTAGKDWTTTQPTVLTVLDAWPMTPNGGLALIDVPLGNECDCALAEGFALRFTAPAAVNVYAAMDVVRI